MPQLEKLALAYCKAELATGADKCSACDAIAVQELVECTPYHFGLPCCT